MQQEMVQLAAAFSAEASYIEPEILKADKATIDKFLAAEPRLKIYRFYLEDVARRAAHTLTDTKRRCSPTLRPVAGSIAERLRHPLERRLPVPDGDAERRPHGEARPGRLQRSARAAEPGRSREGDGGVLQALGGFSRTFGTTMNGEAQKVLFYAKRGRYATALESGARRPEHPITVYTRLVDGVNRKLPTFHRYLGLRKRMLGSTSCTTTTSTRRWSASVNLEYTPEEAQKHILAAIAPLGAEYQATFCARSTSAGSICSRARQAVGRLLARRRLRRAPVHADQLQREVHRRQHAGARARAHDAELSLEQDAAVPAADYPIFVAEVASTFNESLLIDHMLKQIKDDDTRLSLLGNYLENIKGTVFRQTQFAEFELRMHEMAAKGQPITGDALAKLYMDITRKYYGHDQGVASSTTTSRTSGASSRTSTATSTSSSTRRRSPRPRRSRRR